MTWNSFKRLDLFVVLAVLAALLGLGVVGLDYAREMARSEQRTNKMHQIGIAPQTHHDAYKAFPKLSTEPFPQTPGGPETGFSWLTKLHPFMEENCMYLGISTASQKYQPISKGGMGPFGATIVDASGRAYATYQMDSFICPSFSGDPFSDLSQKPPYAEVRGQNLKANPPIGVAISNYVAIPATHIELMKEDGHAADGVIVPGKALTLKDIKDGASRTVIACESKEGSLNAWIDGSVNWVVGANPNNASPPIADAQGFLVLAQGNTGALNVGPGSPTPNTRYLTQANSPNGYEWAWGPSSEHMGGVVMHVYADAAVRFQSDEIDPTVYLQLIMRDGGEKIIDPAVR